MFRELRRSKQKLSKAESIEILKRGRTGVLGLIGDHDYPYTVPMNYVYDHEKIYLHSAKSGHKIDALKANNKLSFCVIDKDELVAEELTTYFRSVIVFGKGKLLTEKNELIKAGKIFGAKFHPDPDFVEKEIRQDLNALACIEINIDHISGKEAIELVQQREHS